MAAAGKGDDTDDWADALEPVATADTTRSVVMVDIAEQGVAPQAKPQGPHGRGSRRSLRTILVLMLSALVAPLLILGAVALTFQWQSQTKQVYQSLTDTASAISVAVDREIYRSRAILETLAASELIDAQQWRALHRLASEAIRTDPDNVIALTEPSGVQPVRTASPYGEPTVNPLAIARADTHAEWNGRRLPLSTQGLAQRVFDSGKPANSALYFGVSIQKPAVAIAVPVIRDGRVAYVLIKAFTVDGLVKLLQDASRPDARISLIDGDGRIIARNERPADAIGTHVSETLRAELKTTAHGTREGTDLDGQPTMTAFRRMQDVDWTVQVSIPKSAALAVATRQSLIWSLLGVTLFALGFYGARRFWLRIAPPIALLGRSARAIQRGEAVDLPRSDIAEIDDLAALLKAAAAMEQSERAETTRRLVAEESERATRELVSALSQSETRFRALFEHSGTGIALLDLATGCFSRVNYRLCEITGCSEQELLERGFEDIVHPDDRAREVACVRELATAPHRNHETELRCLCKGGKIRWVQLHVRHLREPGNSTALGFASFSDITSRKEAEIALQEAGRRKDEFLAMLAHELRNPLAPIRTGAALLIRQPKLDPQIVHTGHIIARQVKHMSKLVDDLLDVSRLTRGLVNLDRVPLDFAKVVTAALDQVGPLIEANRHRLTVRLPDGPVPVLGDQDRLVQAVGNLLTNAAKFTPSGGTITVTLHRDMPAGGRMCLTVEDDGNGIEPELLPKIFDLFTQGPRPADRSQGGLGLGLSLVKRLVELHGGTIRADSAGQGSGATFTLQLRCHDEAGGGAAGTGAVASVGAPAG
jgi:PAS domain S-box-containing protein